MPLPQIGAVLVVLASGAPNPGASELQVPPGLSDCFVFVDDVSPPRLDPHCFYERLLERYRRIARYRDESRVVQVTRHAGDAERQVETRVSCTIDGDGVTVETAAERLRRSLLPKLPLRRPAIADEAERARDLWLAPHMALRTTDESGRDLRAGVEEGFTAAAADAVQVGDRAMVHLELRSGEGTSEADEAKLELWVDVESLLVERVEGTQRLPDGGEFRTRVDIEPIECEDAPPASGLPAAGAGLPAAGSAAAAPSM